MSGPAVLGVVSAAAEDVALVRKRLRRVETRTPVSFDDWTVDGIPLRDLFARLGNRLPRERTFMTADPTSAPFAAESLRALVNEDSRDPERWVRFDDGRVGILFCEMCGDMDCATLSAEVIFDGDLVVWRDIAYQVGYEPFSLDGITPLTVAFERHQYEAVLRGLLTRWA